MAFIDRDAQGRVTAAYESPQHAEQASLPDDDPEVLAIRNPVPGADDRRRAEYPPIGDQLDEIWRWVATAPKATLPISVAEMLDRIEAVKTKYPKVSA